MVWHEMTMFGNDQMIQFTFEHPDELCLLNNEMMRSMILALRKGENSSGV